MEPNIRYTKTSDGVNIAYAIIGDGAPVISVSNAWGDLHLHRSTSGRINEMYTSWADAGLKVALFDGRSMGASDHHVKDLSLDARVLDVEAVATATGFETFALVAIASGVPVAIAYAVKHPDLVSSLVLINGWTKGKDWYSSVPSMRVATNLREMAEDDWETYTLSVASAVTQFSDIDAAASMAKAFRSSTSAGEYSAWIRANQDVDVTPILPQVKARTRVLFVRQMITGTLPFAREMAAKIPHAELLEIDEPTWASPMLADFVHGRTTPGSDKVAPSPFRTILFTDLAGHTEMMRRLGDEKGRSVLREHEMLTRDVLKRYGGSEVKTMGDGFMASFPSVTRGAECAIALQKAFAERNATAEEPLNVRVGLNAGEPIEEDGDLFGETVILAARIAARAQAGEILASTAVRELCAGKGFAFTDRGEQVMKGFETGVRVFEINWKS